MSVAPCPQLWASTVKRRLHMAVLFSIQHFFYCIPIGTVASRYGKPIGATGRNNGRTSGRLARHAGLDRSEEHTSELQSHHDLVCRLLLEKKKKKKKKINT